MAKQPQVLLLGNSVLMDSVAGSLSERKFSNVIRASSSMQEARAFVDFVNPDLIVYEIDGQNTNPIFTFDAGKIDPLHLAIDLKSKRTILAHYQSKPTGSMEELCELVSKEISSQDIEKEAY